MDKKQDMLKLKAELDKYKDRFTTIKDDQEKQVTKWVWATNMMHHMQPLHSERYNTKGRYLKKEPKVKNYKYQYGLDKTDRVLIERQYIKMQNSDYYEKYFLYNEQIPTCIRYSHNKVDKSPISLDQAYIENDKVIKYRSYNDHAMCPQEDYHYKKNKITRIMGETYYLLALDKKEEEIIEYTEFGTVERIINSKGNVLFQKPTRQLNFTELKKIIKEAATYEITQNLLTQKVNRKVYTFILHYSYQHTLPPVVVIGFDEERQKFVKEKGEEANQYIWNPAEFKKQKKIITTNKQLINACKLFNIMDRNKNRSRKLLIEICKELMKIDWSQHFNLSNDFVICPVDLELNDLEENLREMTMKE